MRYSLTFLADQYTSVVNHLFRDPRCERAVYLLCGISESADETRLLVQDVLPVEESEIVESSAVHMKITAPSFLRALKRANESRQCFIFVHSHPAEVPTHSPQDDREERKLFSTAYNRVRGTGVHASVVFSAPYHPIGRVWLDGGAVRPIDVIRIIGDRLRFFYRDAADAVDLNIYDRQVRAFGPDLQRLLKRLRVGVVGAGGTGSSVVEQLLRLGVGHMLVADPQSLVASNVTRVYGSRLTDAGTPKAFLADRLGSEIGLGTEFRTLTRSITFESVLKEFRNCDLIFGCTDDQWGRSLLNRLSTYYIIPVFDMAAKIDSIEGVIRSVQGRVTTLMPGATCLFCRGRIQADRIRAEVLDALNPDEAEQLRREGYAPELADSDPAVITFTTSVAATAINQMLHKLTGFMGLEANATEIICRFDANHIGKNQTASKDDCSCSDRSKWGRGDCGLFLETTWRPD